jgi:hypothetical protein
MEDSDSTSVERRFLWVWMKYAGVAVGMKIPEELVWSYLKVESRVWSGEGLVYFERY